MNEPITSPEWKQEVENDDRAIKRRVIPTPPNTSGIPMLGGYTSSGLPIPAEPILMFDREQNLIGPNSPREQLKYKLEMRHWRADVIEDFLDRLGFKP